MRDEYTILSTLRFEDLCYHRGLGPTLDALEGLVPHEDLLDRDRGESGILRS